MAKTFQEKIKEKLGATDEQVGSGARDGYIDPALLTLDPERDVRVLWDLNDPRFGPSAVDGTFERWIRTNGLSQTNAIVVVWETRRVGDEDRELLVVVDGERRTRTVMKINEEREASGHSPIRVPIKFFTGGPLEVLEESIRQNQQHSNGESPFSICIKARKMLGFNPPMERVLAAFGFVSQSVLDRYLLLERCCPEVQDACDRGELPVSSIPEFAAKSFETQRVALAQARELARSPEHAKPSGTIRATVVKAAVKTASQGKSASITTVAKLPSRAAYDRTIELLGEQLEHRRHTLVGNELVQFSVVRAVLQFQTTGDLSKLADFPLIQSAFQPKKKREKPVTFRMTDPKRRERKGKGGRKKKTATEQTPASSASIADVAGTTETKEVTNTAAIESVAVPPAASPATVDQAGNIEITAFDAGLPPPAAVFNTDADSAES